VETLYHASINATDILANGFSAEVPSDGGLGGSQSDKSGAKAVSFTPDLYTAKEIARSLKEAVAIMHGTFTGTMLMREIQADPDATTILSAWKKNTGTEAQDLSDEVNVFILYSIYLKHSRNRFDPLYFGNKRRMAEAFKSADPKKVGVVVASVDMTNPDILYLPGENELRVPPRAVVSVDKVIR
jgi:hypothetical protein